MYLMMGNLDSFHLENAALLHVHTADLENVYIIPVTSNSTLSSLNPKTSHLLHESL